VLYGQNFICNLFLCVEAMFLTSVAGISMLFGFGASVNSAKKQDPTAFDQGMTPSRKFESGAALASRALKWGSIYAVTGCGLIFFTIWKLMGVNDVRVCLEIQHLLFCEVRLE
jgi:hypothetical protein